MHFQTQYKMNRFDEIILKNLNDEGIRINNFVIKFATYLEEKFIESNEPLQKWMDNNAVDMYYKIAKLRGLGINEFDIVRRILQECWLFGQEYYEATEIPF